MIFGTNKVNIKQAPLTSYPCPNCDQKRSVLAIIASYFSLYFIPVFPYKKVAKIVCLHCRYTQEEEHMVLELKEKVLEMKASIKSPWWMYIGLILVGIFLVFILVV